MKKLIALLLFSPLAFCEEIFLECTKVKKEKSSLLNLPTYNLHIQADKQLLKSGLEYVKYTQGVNGVITWEETKKFDDGSWLKNALFLDRTNGVLESITTNSRGATPINSKYKCKKLYTEF
ncbi:hypothetical protein OAJ69_02055 [Pseudomonadota bacterium]|nr:hypothetical protein [Pseudomonadota bacterium]